MKIDSSSFKAPPLRSTGPATQKPAESVNSGTTAVSLSAAASALKSGSDAPVNSARIQEIKEAIAQGRFKINPEAIADGLVNAARDLLNSQRKA
ncbi:MAG: flagellar biosynthesis anti-sigma factor FlgM [Azonexus sp.]|nr:flagellar biosynthesis anti-sigma factor FlgM [Azonexus sp.]